MKKLITVFATLVILVGLLAISPSEAEGKAANPATVVYNLYATDGYMRLADGEPLYIYGFVGGRKGEAFTYMPSYNPLTGIQAPNVTLPDAPDPTGGPVTSAEAVLGGNAQLPAPVIWATSNDVVEIRLKNLGVQAQPTAPNDPHSIHLHGLDVDAANDGVPETSIGAVPANMCVDGSTSNDCTAAGGPALGAGNVIVYMFHQTNPGTYMYHCHQEADIHVQMGMYGALVIYNPADAAATSGLGPGRGQGGTLWGFKYDKDYILLLTEIDVRQHEDEEGTYTPGSVLVRTTSDEVAEVPTSNNPLAWNPIEYTPQYWLINGLSFPNTIHLDTPGVFSYSDWLAAYPNYDAFIRGSVGTTLAPSYSFYKTPGEKVLIRMINLGFETQPMHIHGFHPKILGVDQRAWTWANKVVWGRPTPFGVGLEKNTFLIGSGETYDLLMDFGQQALSTPQYAPNVVDPETGVALTMWPGSTFGGTQTRYDPTTGQPQANTSTSFPAIPDAGIPGPDLYIGGPVVIGLEGLTQPPGVVGQLFPFHNHDDYKATNDGAYPGGMFTMLEAVP
ncbi:MAG: hypothetical protein EHM70_16560 [Chloroflexota bacterium]|nr:MAG: hypothetical protein EHM70_16560 [Chloroflexota bacterium]